MADAPKYMSLSATLPGVEFRRVVVLREDAEEIARNVNAAVRRAVREDDHPVWGPDHQEEQDG